MESLKLVLLLVLSYSLYMLGNICANQEDDLYSYASVVLFVSSGISLYLIVVMLAGRFFSLTRNKDEF